MTTSEFRPPMRPGDAAPDFTLPAVHRDGTVSLADYRGRSPLLLALFRGIYCPFCRRQIAQLGLTREKLLALGVETLAVVASQLERARLYFRYRPTRVPLAADPDLVIHRAFGVPKLEATPKVMEALRTVRTDASGALPEPLPILDAANALDEMDGFEFTETDTAEAERQFPLDIGQFLVDRDGIVRWANLERAKGGWAGIGQFPTDEELLAAARALGR
ncbi:MAG: redoxin domain-containing protein [Candidatus Rokubacteria bacterium]|nr:redoxin domain-containing protein [Candidatus Rokubacteria bacterium]